MTEKEFAAKVESLGGYAYIVGGYVRDKIMGRTSHDKDYCVSGVSEADFCAAFGEAQKVGSAFPVYILVIDGQKSEVAFARTERKIGRGYLGFEAHFSPEVGIEEDLFRRDTAMNSMAIRLSDGKLLDPYHGRMDIGLHKIRATSEHFGEDPVRALRAARQAAELNFTVEPKTLELMSACQEELAEEPQERLLKELQKALDSPRPSLFFRTLQKAKLLEACFPELFALIGKIQPPLYHPEGDAFEHSLIVLELVAYRVQDTATRFAALVHDIGKGTTPKEMLPHHYKHELKGSEVLDAWKKRMNLPGEWLKMAHFVIQNHMKAPKITHPGKMADLLWELNRRQIFPESFRAIVEADAKDVPAYLQRGEELIEAMKAGVCGNDAPPNLSGAAVGEWLRRQRIEILRRMLHSRNC